jgi:hypothetical protein
MRWFVCLATAMLSSCTVVHDDLEVCDADLLEDRLPFEGRPCSVAELDCYTDCGDDERCVDACYSADPECGNCAFTKPYQCARERGCNAEYERLGCCITVHECGLEPDDCPACEDLFVEFGECSSSVAGCLSAALECIAP